MKYFLNLFLVVAFLTACNQNKNPHVFTLSGDVANIENQEVYLDQFFFDGKDPMVLDTAQVENGKFSLKGHATEQGMFRIRFEKAPMGYIFINDQKEINFVADAQDKSLEGPKFYSNANEVLKQFILKLESFRASNDQLNVAFQQANTDSLKQVAMLNIDAERNNYNNFIRSFIDTVHSPVVAMFAVGYSQSLPDSVIDAMIPALAKRFPDHKGVQNLQEQYQQFKEKSQADEIAKIPGVGDMAPDFTMKDTEGKDFDTKSLRGKYVLIDFWASWCGPCRNENPNIVQAYEKYKSNNFTILGVSLDRDRSEWLQAIQYDKLTWKHVSDLNFWNSPVVSLYGFEGIPYNVLVDPTGKIIATDLRGEDLHKQLATIFP